MSKDTPRIEVRKISELTPDAYNANRGTERGHAMLGRSLEKFGAGRSVLVDKALRIIAGNKTTEGFGAQGGEEVILVHTTGNQLVAVVRDDLDLENDPHARELAYADNRTVQVDLDFDPDQIARDQKLGIDLGDWFTSDEIAKLLGTLDGASNLDPGEDRYREQYGVIVICADEAEQEQVYSTLQGQGYNVRVVVT